MRHRPLVFLLPLVLVVGQQAVARDLSEACVATPVAQREQTFRCVVPPAANVRGVRFEADFSGSHDDTQLALNARAEGAVLACGPGSRTESEREDGDVRLTCRLTVGTAAAAPGGVIAGKAFEIEVRRYHAEPAGWRLLTD